MDGEIWLMEYVCIGSAVHVDSKKKQGKLPPSPRRGERRQHEDHADSAHSEPADWFASRGIPVADCSQ